MNADRQQEDQNIWRHTVPTVKWNFRLGLGDIFKYADAQPLCDLNVTAIVMSDLSVTILVIFAVVEICMTLTFSFVMGKG